MRDLEPSFDKGDPRAGAGPAEGSCEGAGRDPQPLEIQEAPAASVRAPADGPSCASSLADRLTAELREARILLETSRQRADRLNAELERLEARYEGTARELALIHGSKMWRFWMKYIAIRRLFLRLLGL